jgi:glycosyltransferase involved in cell wall biosynthesis
MTVSVIIPTYNRNEVLCRTLSNVLLYKHQYLELIVIDQSKDHDHETTRFLDDLINNKNIKYIFVDYPNLPNARNVGIKSASGDIVIFFDDDVEINNNTIPFHCSGFSQPGIGCVIGKVFVRNLNHTGNMVLENNSGLKKYIKFFIFFILRNSASYVGRLGVLTNFSGNKKLSADTCIGCNMSFRKDVFKVIGYFDLNFTGNAVREDADIGIRLHRSKHKIVYIPQASAIHFMHNTGGTRTCINEAYWNIFFKNQCYFYIKNFNYSWINILFIQLFDLLRCRKSGINAFSVFKKSYREAMRLVIAGDSL